MFNNISAGIQGISISVDLSHFYTIFSSQGTISTGNYFATTNQLNQIANYMHSTVARMYFASLCFVTVSPEHIANIFMSNLHVFDNSKTPLIRSYMTV